MHIRSTKLAPQLCSHCGHMGTHRNVYNQGPAEVTSYVQSHVARPFSLQREGGHQYNFFLSAGRHLNESTHRLKALEHCPAILQCGNIHLHKLPPTAYWTGLSIQLHKTFYSQLARNKFQAHFLQATSILDVLSGRNGILFHEKRNFIVFPPHNSYTPFAPLPMPAGQRMDR